MVTWESDVRDILALWSGPFSGDFNTHRENHMLVKDLMEVSVVITCCIICSYNYLINI